ncbi:hypothetical protein BS78_03G164200 [Paspalum vaginatum]|nr:hypothetical protein BS78_03G164200 [Paspalum vaginatum]
MSPEATAGFHSETSKEIVVALHAECNDSSQHPLGPLLEPVFQKSAGPSPFLHPGVMVDLSAFMPLTVPNSSAFSPVFSTTSLLLMSNHKMEVFNKLPQNPHFREACDCPPEFREGRALGLMLSFANMAESIRNMRIQDGQQHYQEKMNSLLDLEGNGFDVRALKIRLDNLLRVRNHHIHLKSRKESLEKEIFEMKGVNCALERHLKFLDSIMWVAKKYQEMKTSVGIQKAANCSSISKLQVDLHQVEESLVSAEANFCSIAAAPWQSEPDLNYGNPSQKSGEVPLLPYT